MPNIERTFWTEVGTEIGTEKLMMVIIERAICGLKRSGALWRAKLSEILMSLG